MLLLLLIEKLLTGVAQRVQSTTLNSDLKRVLGHSPLANLAAGQLVVRGAVPSPPSRSVLQMFGTGYHTKCVYSVAPGLLRKSH